MEENKKLIEDLYKYFAEGNGEMIASLFYPKIEWKQMEGFPNSGTYLGKKAVFENVFVQFPKYWKGWGAVPQEFIVVDNRVFVLGYYKGKSRATEKYMEAPIVHLYTIKEGLITHFRQYTDTYLVQKTLSNDA